MEVEMVSYTLFPHLIIANAIAATRGRSITPYENLQEKIKRVIEKGHESVLEFASATFRIKGISRACLAQLTRHRLASFAVESQRHVKAKKEVVIPPSIEEDEEKKKIFLEAIEKAYEAYEKLLELGVKKEDARFVLPEGTVTSLLISANFREWRTILKLRLAKDAQWEIRNLCKEILRQLYRIAPACFEDLLEEGEGESFKAFSS